ncbi:hypothetical protein M3661_08860 [Paenibacillus sp. MER 180]|uniref:hypothetical protein n=1 Tax=Paenibacillus sp. MER 180 TaxID=2939570 RepID=UPI00204006CD|nr:hypothetical protein [Paenibacillus sp. MER 180]MCM3290237.1 hypothetical protein [Paenibacillus sp. MER 180]
MSNVNKQDKRNVEHAEAAGEFAFAKEQWLQAACWSAGERDMLHALLASNEQYTKEQIDTLLHQFRIQEVM